MSGGRPEGTSPQGPAALTAPRVVAVLFGGRSLEHDVSIVSGQQILHALDPASCTAIPVYIDQQLRWWIGDDQVGRCAANRYWPFGSNPPHSHRLDSSMPPRPVPIT